MYRALLQFGHLIKPYRIHFVVSSVSVVITGFSGLIFPWVLGLLVDGTFMQTETASPLDMNINQAARLLLGVSAVQALFSAVNMYLLAYIGENIVSALRIRLYEHIMLLSNSFFDQQKTGEISSRLMSDAAVLQNLVSTQLTQFFRQIIMFVGGIVFLLSISFTLTFVVLAVIPPVALFTTYFGSKLRIIANEHQNQLAAANATAEETLTSIRIIQWFHAKQIQIGKYTNLIQQSLQSALRRARINAAFTPLMSLLFSVALIVVLWAGSRLIQDDHLTSGDLVAFLLYTFTTGQAIIALAGLFVELQRALGASQRIFELFALTSQVQEPVTPIQLHCVRGDIQFERVTFRYSNRDQFTLTDIDLHIQPGEKLAFVGPSGAGKSTLISLLPRLYDVNDGRILLDGIDIRNLQLAELRTHIAAVTQEAQLLSGTISENIRLGRPDATEDEVIAAAITANAHNFVMGFEDGYATLVGDRGLLLSTGQRQRIAIARALLRDPRILILDEATSALDTESEAVVLQALEKLMEGRTTLMITHRLGIVHKADRIVVLNEGCIVEHGTNDTLLKSDGLYASLCRHQSHINTDVSLLS